MSVRIVVGINWGDEGKGRMVDYFAADADIVVRYQGGSNAGHTIVNDYGTFKLHLIPSGVFYRNIVNILGPGTAVNLEFLSREIETLEKNGISINKENYKISDRAMICFPYHVLQDVYEEERLKNKKFGSTKQGIAPVYSDLYLKYGIQVGSLLYPPYLREQIARVLGFKNEIFRNVYKKPEIKQEEIYDWAMSYGEKLRPFICDTIQFFDRALEEKKNVLLEAQLGALRDILYGIYPYTTSSSPLADYGPLGSGLFSREKTVVTGVMKAFSTCVGEGPFVTEMEKEEGDKLRELAGEYGARTGRPRRVGYFDVVASRYGVKVQQADEVCITKLDCLSGMKKLKICTHYKVNGKKIDYFPIMPLLIQSEPEYIEVDGWDENLNEIRDYRDLPEKARAYVEVIEEMIRKPIKYISVGPERESLIVR